MSENTIEIRSLKAIVKGAGIVFMGTIISKFIIYFYRVFIARHFGAEDYGLFSLGLAVIGIVSIFSIFGLSSGVARYVPFYKAKSDDRRIKGTITSAMKLVFLPSALLTISLFILSPAIATRIFHDENLTNVIRILSLSIPFFSFNSIFNSTFRGFQKIQYTVYSDYIISNALKTALVIVFGVFGFGVLGIAWSWTIAVAITSFISLYFLEKKVFPILKTTIKGIPLKRELLYFSIPLMFTGVFEFMISWTDTLMLGYFMTTRDVGIYNAAMPTARILVIFSSGLTVLFLPVLTELLADEKRDEMKNVFKRVTKWVFFANFPLLLLFITFSKQIMQIIFGTAYIEGYIALSTLTVGFMTVSLMIIGRQTLLAIKKTKYLMLNMYVAGISNIFLNLYLIPIYGIFGAALASVSSLFIEAVLISLELWLFLRLTFYSHYLIKSIAAGVISITLVNFVALAFFPSFPTYILAILLVMFFIIYASLVLVFRSLDVSDIEILKAIERKTGVRIEFLRNLIKRFI